MFTGFRYAVTCYDGSGKAVCRETAWIDDLDECYLPLSEFIEGWKLDWTMDDALDKLYEAHYVQDKGERELVWEIRAIPMLNIV